MSPNLLLRVPAILNPQSASLLFAVPRAYLDQLARNNGLPADRITAVRAELSRAEQLSGLARHDAPDQFATQLHTEARSASDQPRAHQLASAIGDLAKAVK